MKERKNEGKMNERKNELNFKYHLLKKKKRMTKIEIMNEKKWMKEIMN